MLENSRRDEVPAVTSSDESLEAGLRAEDKPLGVTVAPVAMRGKPVALTWLTACFVREIERCDNIFSRESNVEVESMVYL